MKKTVLLHGTSGTSDSNWIPWLATEIRKTAAEVYAPDLPNADRPNRQRYNAFLRDHLPWALDEDTIIVGHSSGAVAALSALELLPENSRVRGVVLVGAFKDDLGWEALNELFVPPMDYAALSKRAEKFLLLHSDNDPYCPLEHAEFLATELHGELRIFPGEGHFNLELSERYREFPVLLGIVKEMMKGGG